MSKVSVIVPIYNSEKTINRCVESIINQTYKDIEILLINDGSIDNTLNILNDYANKDKRIVVINKKNEGVSKTKNLGIKKAKSEFIMFVDSDDYIDKEAIKKLVLLQKNDNLDIIKFHYNNYVDDKLYNTELKYPNYCVLDNEKKIKEFKNKFLSGEIPGYMQLLFIRKSSLGNLLIDDKINFLEDLTFYLDLLDKNIKIGILNERLYNYVNNKNGITFSLSTDKVVNRLNNILLYYKHTTLLNFDKEQRQLIYNSCSYLIIHSLFELYRVSFKNKKLIKKYLKDDEIISIITNANCDKLDRFTKRIVKNYNNLLIVFFYLFITKIYICIKERM